MKNDSVVRAKENEMPDKSGSTSETQEQFFANYAARSGTTVGALQALGLSVCPCECGQLGCDGWQVLLAMSR